MSFDHATPANIADLTSLSHLEPLTCAAWLHCEAQSIDNPTNPLNIRFWGRPGQLRGPGATGVAGVGFASYGSAGAGLADAWRLLTDLAPNYGYGAILAAAGGSDPLLEARAIELSSWAAGHYGGSATADGCLRRYVRANLAPPTTGGDLVRSFTFDATRRVGTLVVNGPGHEYLRLRDNTLHGPIDPATFGTHQAFGPVTLVGGGISGPTDTRTVGYIVGTEAAFLIEADVTFTPDPAATPDDPAADAAEQKTAVNAALDTIQAAVTAARPT